MRSVAAPALVLRWRDLCGLVVAVLGVLLVFPLSPLATWLRGWLASTWPGLHTSGLPGLGPWTHLLPQAGTLLCLVVGALLMRAPRADATNLPPYNQVLGLGAGMLFVLEPFIVLGVLAATAVVGGPAEVDLVLPPPGQAPMLWRLLILATVAPICEELFFRGRLLPWLAVRVGRVQAWWLSSLLFAAAHGSLVTAAAALPVGLLCGWLRLMTRSRTGTGRLLPCILLHLLHNLLLVLAGGMLIAAPLPALVLALGGAWMLALMVHLLREDRLRATRLAAAAQHEQPPSRRTSRVLTVATRRLGLRYTALVLGSFLLVAGLWQPYRWAADQAWAAAALRLVTHPACDALRIQRGLRNAQTRGLLSRNRQSLLAARLETFDTSNAELYRVLRWHQAVVDPSIFTRLDERVLDQALAALWSYPTFDHQLQRLGIGIALRQPAALVQFAVQDPEALAMWLPLPQHANLLAELLCQLESPLRKRLHKALHHAYGDSASAVLWAIPSPKVTTLDRYLFHLDYKKAADILRAWQKVDRSRAAVWEQGGGGSE